MKNNRIHVTVSDDDKEPRNILKLFSESESYKVITYEIIIAENTVICLLKSKTQLSKMQPPPKATKQA